MLFNSFDFLLFFIGFLILYWTTDSIKIQNVLILIGSYIFYGLWSYKFLSLIIISSCADFILGKKIASAQDLSLKRTYLTLSLVINLGMLFIFKYFNFFRDNLELLLNQIGFEPDIITLDVILPVGISFYTFQTLSYSIDIYRDKLKPSNNLIQFYSFVAFFPQLVAGPIERATNLLPQFNVKRELSEENLILGLRQILWGFFKKVVVADNCALIVDYSFNNLDSLSSGELILAAIAFSFQIYGDFSGYSDIAIGLARLLGFKLMVNFKYPYFSRDIAEFWRRWHISLSTWFRDYLYIPLGGSRVTKGKAIRNIFIIFLVSGFWHGANWTFIIWGGLNAAYFLPQYIFKSNRKYLGDIQFADFKDALLTIKSILLTFILTTIAWVFFRSDSLDIALHYLYKMASFNDILGYAFLTAKFGANTILYTLFAICLVLIVEWLNRIYDFGLYRLPKSLVLRYTIYLALFAMVFNDFISETSFIYFQF